MAAPTEAERVAELHRQANADYGTAEDRRARAVAAAEQSFTSRGAGNQVAGRDEKRRSA